MVKGLTSRGVLDKIQPIELQLELLSFAGGENTIGEDQELASNEARVIQNWVVKSLGGMQRAGGFTEVADDGAGAPSYSGEPYDLLAHHFESTNTETYGVLNGDLVIKSGTDINQEDASAFTADALCHAVSAGSTLYITNSTDNLKYKTIGNAIATPTTTPTNACKRIYEHNFRLIAEGDSANTVYGSMAGSGNWNGAGGWSTSNDAWSIVMPDATEGCVPGFPSGNDVVVFTKFDTFIISNQPNVTRRRVINGIGCSNGYAVARGNEGVFFPSEYPSKGIFLWDGVNYVDLTERHDFIDDVNFSQRMFGVYKDNKYIFIYNETGSGVSYPNKMRIYDTLHGRWMERPVHEDLADNFGYPSLQTKDDNELFIGSSRGPKLYDFDDGSTSDAGNDTEATYKTKYFTSRDFSAGGRTFPIDNVRMKLTHVTATFKGTTGSFSIGWSADRGRLSGSQTFDLTASGDRLNVDFTLNTSQILASLPTKTETKTFGNGAVGTDFQFEILNSDTGAIPEVKKIKIHAIALEET